MYGQANYHVLIEGMKNIQEVDLDLVSAGVQTVNSRRKLSVADNGMRLPMFKVGGTHLSSTHALHALLA